jgi:GT2 family glycosyltransferase
VVPPDISAAAMIPQPRFSVVVPTYQRPHALAQTLDCLTAERQQLEPQTFEVIVADDSRDTVTERMVAAQYPSARYVRGPRRGPAANRNCGVAAARGEWVAFVDDDCLPVKGWLSELSAAASASMPDVIEGATLSPNKVDDPFGHYVENLTGGLYWSCNLAIRRSVFLALGGFDEDFGEPAGEDLEFAERIRKSGVATVFSPTAAVVHPWRAVSWRYIVWRTFAIRWHLLYALKAGQAPPAHAPAWKALSFLVINRIMNLGRMTWRAVRGSETTGRRSTMFNVAVSWLTFPIVLPYMMYWDVRFRRMVRRRASS